MRGRNFVSVLATVVVIAAGAALAFFRGFGIDQQGPDSSDHPKRTDSQVVPGLDHRGPDDAGSESLEGLFLALHEAAIEGRREQGEQIADRIIRYGPEAAEVPRTSLLERASLYEGEGVYKYLLIRVLKGIASGPTSEILFRSVPELDAARAADIDDTESHGLGAMVPVIALHPTEPVREGALRLLRSSAKRRLVLVLLRLAGLIGAGDPRFAEAIRPLLTSEDPEIRAAAIKALGLVGDMSDIAELAVMLGTRVEALENQITLENYNLAEAVAARLGPEGFLELMRDSIRRAKSTSIVTALANGLYLAARNRETGDWAFVLGLIDPTAHPMEQLVGTAILNMASSSGVSSGPDVQLSLESLFLSTDQGLVKANVLVAFSNMPDGDEPFHRLFAQAVPEGGRLEESALRLLPSHMARHPESPRTRSLIFDLLQTADTSRKVILLNEMRVERVGTTADGTDPFQDVLAETMSNNPDPEARAAARAILEENRSYLRKAGNP